VLFALLAGVGLLAVVSVALVVGLGLVARRSKSGIDEDAIVRVVTGDVRGTGFFIQPPPGMDGAFVVTAFHVVSAGQPVIIERRMPMAEHRIFVEAYPETELAAFDADADLAILHVKNVPARRFAALKLAEQPVKNEAIVSAGFPPSGVANRAELSTRPGRIDQLVRLDAVDPVLGKVTAANKNEGLLVDTNLEPGFSGGPTVNAAGEVVGVNVLKDTIHRGQDGAVSVVVLRQLIKTIKPYAAPTAQDAEALLKKVQEEYLMLPVDDRAGVSVVSFLSNAELPQLRAFLREMRSMEGDHRLRELGKDLRLANNAVLGILLARLPGKSLETYQASSTHDRIAGCEDRTRAIERFLGPIGVDGGLPRAEGDCLSYALRPLAWDLTASTLEWEGAVREYKVMKLEAIDEEARIFQASVRIPGVSSLLPIHMVWEAGGLRLKLFDKGGGLYALQGARSATARDFEGSWGVAQARRPEPGTEGVESEKAEKLTVTISGTDNVSVVHEYTAGRFATRGAFRCNLDKTITTKVAEALSGHLHNGIVTGGSDKFEYLANGCDKCKLCYAQDRLFLLKRYGGNLLFYRTDGSNAPEAIVLTKQ
jgi:S1-C subfamily serine protease